jgi:predicted small secreted protein
MKKLLLVLMVVALAAFLLVGCIPSTPAEGEGEGEGEVEICPTVSVTSQAAVGGKTYIKGGKQTITVTFAVPTEPISVYVGSGLRLTLEELLQTEVVMYPNADKTVYTGTFKFGVLVGVDGCSDAYIYVETCDTCNACTYPYTVDTGKPFIGKVEICVEDCTCAGCGITFTSGKTPDCDPCDPKVYCGDCCSGFASWAVDIYAKYPFDQCCDTPCIEPIDSGTGTCQVDFTTKCLEESTATPGRRTVWALVTLLDNVGNKTKTLTQVTVKPDTCDVIGLSITPYTEGVGIDEGCVDTPDFVVCD